MAVELAPAVEARVIERAITGGMMQRCVTVSGIEFDITDYMIGVPLDVVAVRGPESVAFQMCVLRVIGDSDLTVDMRAVAYPNFVSADVPAVSVAAAVKHTLSHMHVFALDLFNAAAAAAKGR